MEAISRFNRLVSQLTDALEDIRSILNERTNISTDVSEELLGLLKLIDELYQGLKQAIIIEEASLYSSDDTQKEAETYLEDALFFYEINIQQVLRIIQRYKAEELPTKREEIVVFSREEEAKREREQHIDIERSPTDFLTRNYVDDGRYNSRMGWIEKGNYRVTITDSLKKKADIERVVNALREPFVGEALFALRVYAQATGKWIWEKPVRLTDVIVNYYNDERYRNNIQAKKRFTQAIQILNSVEIHWAKDWETKIGYFHFRYIYLTKEIYGKYKEDVYDEKGNLIHRKGEENREILLEFSGVLFWGLKNDRTRSFPRALSELRGGAFRLAVYILNRINYINELPNQKSEVREAVKFTRGDLIKAGGFGEIDKKYKTRASERLYNTLKKLVRKELIADFNPKNIPRDNEATIFIIPKQDYADFT
jgi:hypothetical protein